MLRSLNLSAMTRVFSYMEEESGQWARKLDMAQVTAFPVFDDFEGLRLHVLEDLRYPRPTTSKLESYAWVPTLYVPSYRVVRGEMVEGCWRSGEAEADTVSLMYADIDNQTADRALISEQDVAERKAAHFGPTRFFTYTSHSSKPARRKFRVVFDTSRDLTRDEMHRVFVVLNEAVFDRQGDGSIYDRGDMLFAPPYTTEITDAMGEPLDVDLLLECHAELVAADPEIAARYAPKVKHAPPSRALTPEEIEAMKIRMANDARQHDFGGIADPQVFNAAWMKDFANTTVQGSHYSTMLSLLGRVWRKSAGQLTYGQMRQIFDEIDATAAFYMQRSYPSDKPGEMVRFVMSQPVLDERPATRQGEDLRAMLRAQFRGG